MKKKRTLNQTWTLCLRMWRWIAKVWQTPRYRRYDISDLKRIWLKKNGYKNGLWCDCFFCDYKSRGVPCSVGCPGAMVDRNFRCTRFNYHWIRKPIEFYKELLRLNKIRKAKK